MHPPPNHSHVTKRWKREAVGRRGGAMTALAGEPPHEHIPPPNHSRRHGPVRGAVRHGPVRGAVRHRPVRGAVRHRPVRGAVRHGPVRGAVRHRPVRGAVRQ